MRKRVAHMIGTGAMLAALSIARPALAGPPLLCHPFDIGTARSLPMAGTGWHAIDRAYDANRLVDDTLALLGPETPVLVRMETLRRATMYGMEHPQIATALLATLRDRAKVPTANAGLAVFDFGYLVETMRQAAPVFKRRFADIDNVNGYQLVLKARALQSDPAMDHAAKLIAAGERSSQ
jgi:hypothetical protein